MALLPYAKIYSDRTCEEDREISSTIRRGATYCARWRFATIIRFIVIVDVRQESLADFLVGPSVPHAESIEAIVNRGHVRAGTYLSCRRLSCFSRVAEIPLVRALGGQSRTLAQSLFISNFSLGHDCGTFDCRTPRLIYTFIFRSLSRLTLHNPFCRLVRMQPHNYPHQLLSTFHEAR